MPNFYEYSVGERTGGAMPSQLGTHYFVANTYGVVETGPNDHDLAYDPNSDSIVAVFTSNHPTGGSRVTYVASVRVTSSHLAAQPSLTIARSGTDIVIRWPASATGYVLESSPSLTTPAWTGPAGGTPAPDGEFLRVTIPAPTGNTFFRLEK